MLEILLSEFRFQAAAARVAMLLLFSLCAALSASANCYVLRNNTNYPQLWNFQYNQPLGNNITQFKMDPHGHYPAEGQWCWNTPEGYKATVLVAPGAYVASWGNAPFIMGNSSAVSPTGTYSLNPPSAAHVQPPPAPPIHLTGVRPLCGASGTAQVGASQPQPDGTILSSTKYEELVMGPSGPHTTGKLLGFCLQQYTKNGATYRTIYYAPDGAITSDCYADVTNHTCIQAISDGSVTSTTYGDKKQIVSRSRTCRGVPMAEESYDADGWLDGVFRDGHCGPTDIVDLVVAEYDHGVLNGQYFEYNCYFTTTGEYNRGLRWGTWHFAAKTDPNCQQPLGPRPAVNIPDISLVNGTGTWSVVTDRMPSAQGALVTGLEEGPWSYYGLYEDIFSASGSFVHGVKQGEWKEFLTSTMPTNVLKKGDLRAQYNFVDELPNGRFVVYDVATGERIEGEVSGGFPEPCESIAGFDFGAPYLIWSIASGVQRGHDWGNSAPGGKPQQPTPIGKLTGVWTFYDHGGQLLHTEDLNNGNGHFTYWNSSGDIVCEGVLVDGQKNGLWTQRGPGGHPTMTFTFDHGVSNGFHSVP